MNALESLTIDLADPQSIAEKLPEAEARLTGLEAQLQQQGELVTRWREMIAMMRTLVNAPPGAGAGPGQNLTELQALVVGAVNREVRKIRARDVTAILQAEGHAISGDSVSNCLWYVAEKIDPKPIQRIGRGFYAPLVYEEPKPSAAEAAGSLAAGAGLGALVAHSIFKASGG